MTSRAPTPADIAGLPFEEDGPMYTGAEITFVWFDEWGEFGDFDTPEQNERAREILRKLEGDK